MRVRTTELARAHGYPAGEEIDVDDAKGGHMLETGAAVKPNVEEGMRSGKRVQKREKAVSTKAKRRSTRSKGEAA